MSLWWLCLISCFGCYVAVLLGLLCCLLELFAAGLMSGTLLSGTAPGCSHQLF
jgi:hypothetical protein